jgi:LCP family protein required for cell wall assembly
MTSPETDGGAVVLPGAGPSTEPPVESADVGAPPAAAVAPDRRRIVAATPPVAAVLSFLLPGLGQASAGAIRRGALMAIPTLAVVVAAAGAFVAGAAATVGLVLRPEIIVALLGLNIAFGLYHLVAVVDAWRVAMPRFAADGMISRTAHATLGTMVVGTVVLHGAIGLVGYQTWDTLGSIFPGDDARAVIPVASFDPLPLPSGLPNPTPGSSDAPAAAGPAWAADGLLNLLLIGSDAGPDRWSLRTDTMIVLSVDVATARAALIGIPRNLVGVPLAPESARAFRDGRFPDLLNALYVYAMDHPTQFPGGDARGFRAVTGAIQELLGLQIDGLTVINLQGFVSLVNAIGGLWIDIPEPLYDPSYPLETGRGHIVLSFKAGCQKLNGRMALAYARSRHQDSDYQRMRRQQAVLTALARQVDPIAMLARVTELLGIAKDNLWTTIARDDVAGLAQVAARVNPRGIETVTLTPPDFPSPLTTATISKIRLTARLLLVDHEVAPTAAPTLRPGARPTATPRVTTTPAPSPSPSPSTSPRPCPAA